METVFNKNVSKRLKSLLIVLMFWGHMFNHPERIWNGVTWISLFSIKDTPIEIILCPFFHVSVPLFFFISGYGFFLSHREKLNKTKMKKQVINLYKHYWIVFIIAVPLCYALGKLRFHPLEFFLNFIGISSSYCGEWWFVSTYIEILVLFWITSKYLYSQLFIDTSNRTDLIVMNISIAIATCGYGFYFFLKTVGIDTDELLLHEIYYLLIKQPFFVIGFLCAKRSVFDKISDRFYQLKPAIKILNTIILLTVLLFVPYIEIIPETYLYIIYLPVFVICFCFLDKRVSNRVKKVFIWISNYTTYMWLCHSILLYKLIQPIIFLPRISVFCWILLIVISLLSSMLFSVIEKLLMKFLSVYMDVYLGGEK